MSIIRFYKANELPAAPTPSDDGVWFVLNRETHEYQHFIITGGSVMQLKAEGGGIALSAGEGLEIDPGVPEIYLLPATVTDLGGIKLWKGSQVQYEELGSYDGEALYVIAPTNPIGSRKVFQLLADHTWSGSQSRNLTFDKAIAVRDWAEKIKATITWTDITEGYKEFSWYLTNGIISNVNDMSRSSSGGLSLSLNVVKSFTIPAGAKLILEY